MEALQEAGLASYMVWPAILFCLSQSAMFSGLNLAFFSVSRLRLEVDAANGNAAAKKVLLLRSDANFVLTTVLWGNVGINVLLTLLSNSVMVGVGAFLFSTVAITIGGEILPQAYFSRHALRMVSILSPIFRVYQILLYVIAKPSAIVLDLWLGKEGIQYWSERDLRQLIHRHIDSAESDIDVVEGMGALNFLAIDDVSVSQEGEIVDVDSIVSLTVREGRPVFFPDNIAPGEGQQRFVQRVTATPHRWVILADENNTPLWALEADAYLRAVHCAANGVVDPFAFCHIPIVVTEANTRLGAVICRFKAQVGAQSDAPIKNDIILLWSTQKRIITGSDILGRLLKGIGLYSAIRQHRR